MPMLAGAPRIMRQAILTGRFPFGDGRQELRKLGELVVAVFFFDGHWAQISSTVQPGPQSAVEFYVFYWPELALNRLLVCSVFFFEAVTHKSRPPFCQPEE